MAKYRGKKRHFELNSKVKELKEDMTLKLKGIEIDSEIKKDKVRIGRK